MAKGAYPYSGDKCVSSSKGALTANKSHGMRKGHNSALTGKGSAVKTNMDHNSGGDRIGAGKRTFSKSPYKLAGYSGGGTAHGKQPHRGGK